MNRTALVSGFWILVILAAGLAGCGTKKTEKDVYQVEKPPVLKTTGEKIEYSAWNADSQKALDIQDAFDISNSKPVRTDVTANCRRDGMAFSQTFSIPGARPIKVLQVLPEEILAQAITVEFLKVTVECGFEISLFNEAGSRFVFNVPLVPIGEYGHANAELQMHEYLSIDSFHPLIIKDYALEQTILTYKDEGLFNAKMICQDASSKIFPFTGTTALSPIKFEELILRSGRSPNVLINERPVQKCRMLVLQNATVIDASPYFTLLMPVGSFSVKTQELVKVFQPRENPNENIIVRALKPLKSASVAVAISNPSPAERFIRVPKAPLTARHEFYMHFQRNVVKFTHPSQLLTIQDEDGATISVEEGEFLVATIPRGATVFLVVTYGFRPLPFCDTAHIPLLTKNRPSSHITYLVTPLEGVQVEEVSPDRSVLSSLYTGNFESVYVTYLPDDSRLESFVEGPSPNYCTWP